MLKAALACGLIPMVAGTAIFATWFVTGIRWLEPAGMILVSLGQLMVLAGLTCLLVFVVRAVQAGRPWRRAALAGLGVLLVNFPLCFVYIVLAIAVKEADIVTLRNNSDRPVDRVTLTAPGGETSGFGPVAPGETRAFCTNFPGEGSVSFLLAGEFEPQAGTLIGYTTSMIGSQADIVLTGNGPPRITEGTGQLTGTEFLRLCLR